jgi:CheY-like chemotaxis protein
MRRILVVEDEPVLREVYELVLGSEPFIVNLAENGQVALELCRQNTYDLILLDLMMPVLDGVGFLRAYAHQAPPTTRIIVLSNLSSGQALEEAIKLGAHRTELKANISPKQLSALVRYELDAS